VLVVIGLILTAGCQSQIDAAIVESVPIPVINRELFGWLQQETMEIDARITGAASTTHIGDCSK